MGTLPTGVLKQSNIGRKTLPTVIADKHADKAGLGQAAYGEALVAGGKKVRAAGETVIVEMKRQSRIEAAKAESAVYQEALRIGAAVEEEFKNDPGKMQGEYEKRFKVVRDKAAKNIPEPEDRAAFDLKTSDLLARGAERTRLKAKSRGHEIGAANLMRNVENNLTVAIAMDDPLMQGHIYNTTREYIVQSVNKGDITPRQGLLMGEKFMEDFGVGVVSNMETERALEMLKRGRTTDLKTGRYTYTEDPDNPNPADYINDVDRSKMIRTLEGRDKAEKYEVDLVTREDIIMDKVKDNGWTRTRALEEVGKAPPKYRHDLRQRVEAQFDNVEKETLRVLRRQQQAEDKAMLEAEELVRQGKGTVSAIDLKLELRRRIGADGMAAIDLMAKRLRDGKRPKPSAKANEAYTNIMLGDEEKISKITPKQFLEKYWELLPKDQYDRALAHVTRLKGADQKELRRLGRQKASMTNGNRAVASIIKSQKLKRNADADTIGALGQRMDSYVQEQFEQGHAVTQPEANKFAAGLLLEGYIEGTGTGMGRGIRRVAVGRKTGRRIQFLGTAQEAKFRLDLDKEDWPQISVATDIPIKDIEDIVKDFISTHKAKPSLIQLRKIADAGFE